MAHIIAETLSLMSLAKISETEQDIGRVCSESEKQLAGNVFDGFPGQRKAHVQLS